QSPASTPSMADRFSAVVRMGRALASSLSISDVHRALREGTSRVLRVNRCLLFQVDGGEIRGHDAPLSAVRADAVSACVSARSTQVVDLPEGAGGTPLSVICVPVLARGAVVRVIYAEQRGMTGFFGRQEVRLAEFLATLAGAALENTAGFQAVRALSRSLEERTIELTQRNEELVAIKEELEAFSYSVAHDLRGGLVNIHGYSSALMDDVADQLDELGRVYLERLRANALRLDRLTEALMMLSGIARTEMTRRPVDLSALARQIAADIDERRGGGVVWRIEPGLEAQADPDLMRIALHNLLDNAAKYAQASQPPTVGFGRAAEGGFEVFDNGVGFDPANADKLFRPFQRLHGDAFEGHGVGLVTVQRVVRRHGGQIEAEGRPGEGARFVFTLPEGDPPASR
ncbi:MAG: hypothetical protein KC613_13190, partial [Myxococcales bacterium]|nr:hypothetical protein [Myxococcales bacterium]